MATNNTIPPIGDEKKNVQMPVYDNQTETGTYYGEQGNEQADVMRQMIADYVSRTDPQAQAEQDARTQRGRKFWTGANLFANVIANAINANGTAKGAPNMTWNDNAQQKMYDTWQQQDRELKADRKAAQQRIDALRMQDAQMRAAGAEKRAAEQKAANDMNFQIALEQARHERGRQEAEADWNRNQEAQDRVRQETQQFQEKLARIRAAGGGTRSTNAPTDYSVSVGSLDLPAKDKKEAEKIRKDIANKIVERYNAGVEERNAEKRKGNKYVPDNELEKPINKPKNDKESEGIIYQLGGMYDEDDGFRRAINEAYGIEDIYDDGFEQQETQKPEQQETQKPKHWMDVPMGQPYPWTPGYLTSQTQTQNTQGSPWNFPKKK